MVTLGITLMSSGDRARDEKRERREREREGRERGKERERQTVLVGGPQVMSRRC